MEGENSIYSYSDEDGISVDTFESFDETYDRILEETHNEGKLSKNTEFTVHNTSAENIKNVQMGPVINISDDVMEKGGGFHNVFNYTILFQICPSSISKMIVAGLSLIVSVSVATLLWTIRDPVQSVSKGTTTPSPAQCSVLLLVGGHGSATSTETVTDCPTLTTIMPHLPLESMVGHIGGYYGGRVVIGGGATQSTESQKNDKIYYFNCYAWTPGESEWNILPKHRVNRYSAASTEVPDVGLVVTGGFDPSGTVLGSAEVYDRAEWKDMPVLHEPVYDHCAAFVSDQKKKKSLFRKDKKKDIISPLIPARETSQPLLVDRLIGRMGSPSPRNPGKPAADATYGITSSPVNFTQIPRFRDPRKLGNVVS